jgi:ketohexokinase
MANILVTGIATLDIINRVAHYPREDEELRAEQQYLRRGGNASNTCSVLRQLGDACQFAGTLADDMAGRFLRADIEQTGIQFSADMMIANGSTPTSYITLNATNGSRTIVHYRDLPELSSRQFEQLDLSSFDWFHFEGRNTEHSRYMMRRAAASGKPLSLEVEKPRDELDSLMEQAGVIMFSRAFAQNQGFIDASTCLRHYAERYPRALLTCSWGEQGAWGWHAGQLLHSPAFPPAQIIDTIGAGDTFNAGLIHSLNRHGDLSEALAFACRLAGKKCGQTGFDRLGTAHD